MSYLTPEELKTVIDPYKVEQITKGDNTIVLECISAAIQEVSSYLGSRFDTVAIFSAQADDRDPLILEYTKDVSAWFLIRRSNVDIDYEKIKERYDRAVEWLTKVADGTVTPNLPPAKDDDGQIRTPFSYGSMEKQIYDY